MVIENYIHHKYIPSALNTIVPQAESAPKKAFVVCSLVAVRLGQVNTLLQMKCIHFIVVM